ncbi:MAG: type II toxin-antitoxin system RelB/DinJ family antitoxin, partial [bacterium]
MAKSAMIRARIEPELKESAEAVLESLGITPTEAITLSAHKPARVLMVDR